jgi:hypothetical protein
MILKHGILNDDDRVSKKYKRKFRKRYLRNRFYISVNIEIVIRPVSNPSSFLSLRSFEMKHKERRETIHEKREITISCFFRKKKKCNCQWQE